jgi:hypothetical protein
MLLCITLNRTSIDKLSFEKDNNKSARSHKGEVIKNILQFCKVGCMMTHSDRHSGMANQYYLRSCGYISLFIVDNQPNSTRQKDSLVKIIDVENTVASGLGYSMVPVESFERSSTGTSC